MTKSADTECLVQFMFSLYNEIPYRALCCDHGEMVKCIQLLTYLILNVKNKFKEEPLIINSPLFPLKSLKTPYY